MWKTNSGKSSCLSPINCMGEKVFPSFAFLSKSRNQKVLKFGGDRSEFSRRENFLPDDFNQNNMTHKTEPHSRTLGNGWKMVFGNRVESRLTCSRSQINQHHRTPKDFVYKETESERVSDFPICTRKSRGLIWDAEEAKSFFSQQDASHNLVKLS